MLIIVIIIIVVRMSLLLQVYIPSRVAIVLAKVA